MELPPFEDDRAALTEKKNVNAFHGDELMKEHNYALQKADKPRLRSSTQNICSVISISPVVLELMIKITSIFVSYRFLRMARHYILSLSDHFPASWNSLYIPYDLAVESKSKCSSSLVKLNAWTSQRLLKSNPQVLIWKTLPCLKFGKTSNRTVENLPQRKLWFWASKDARSRQRFWYHRASASAWFFWNDSSSHSRVRTRLITKSVYYEWASDSFAYPCPCNNSWYARASPRVKKREETRERAIN